MITLGSAFDGIGVFPLCAIENGIIPIWASEIERFPMQVSSRHFPDMKHLGDISKINGGEIDPVDIFTFGSPCQDLSVAGKRKGINFTGKYRLDKPVRSIKKIAKEIGEFRRFLISTQSGLFLEAVRMIREMRDATDGKYPRFAVWENVPGALSSNNGRDFRTVLEELLETEIPVPRSAKWIKTKSGKEQKLIWANAGMVRGDGRSLAWRILDAQYWGVPQRRKRIFLVADFGGQCAGEILFEPQSMSGDSQEGEKEREEVASVARTGVNSTVLFEPRSQDGVPRIHRGGVVPTLNTAQGGQRQPCIAQCVTTGTGRRYDAETETLVVLPKTVGCLTAEGSDSNNAHGHKGFCTNQAVDAGHIIVEPVTQFGGIAGTLTARHDSSPCTDRGQNIVVHPQITGTLLGSGAVMNRPAGNKNETDLIVHQPVVSIQHSIIGRKDEAGAQPIAFNGRQDPVSGPITGALDTDQATQCVMQPYPSEITNPLLAKGNLSYRGDMDNLVYSVDCRNLYENEELSGTLQSKPGGGHSLNYQNPVRIGYLVRRLTPVECERLQGLEDNYTAGGSDSQRYRAIGNSMAKPCPNFVIQGIKRVLEMGN